VIGFQFGGFEEFVDEAGLIGKKARTLLHGPWATTRFGPGERHAVATRYQACESNAQLRIHNALLLHAETISTVMVSARTVAERSEIGALCNPRQTPMMAGRRNKNKQSLNMGIQRKKNEGNR
jgi:hypothetical protein